MVEKTARGQICKWKVGYKCKFYKELIFVVLKQEQYNYGSSSDRAKSKQLKVCR